MNNSVLFILVLSVAASCTNAFGQRTRVSLNGEWEIGKTSSFTQLPTAYTSKALVPGLVDLAVPALDTSRSYTNSVYWYKTNFTVGREHELVQLRVGKAKYHTQVYLNGRFVGEQVYCFSSVIFNIHQFLKPSGEKNELVIGVGTKDNMPDTVIWGKDFEKKYYIPGIYDDVSLVLSGVPFIRNIQVAPMIDEQKVRIVAGLDYVAGNTGARLSYVIKELKSGKVVAGGKTKESDFTVSIPGCKLWSPESPFLYELELSTAADNKTTRFGMRSFSFDPRSGRALLNGKPYYLCGTNVCIDRFFEDAERGNLPWSSDWVTRLHGQFKNMHWNSIRYCIGTPPDRWYDIADSLGFLIQDEYAVWTMGSGGYEKIYPGVGAKQLANEYRAWMSDRWNHPCVVIWDAQNESVTKVTGEAINMARGEDLSNRPWENGWSAPQSENDPMEAHTYLFSRFQKGKVKPSDKGPLSDFLGTPLFPHSTANNRMPPKDKARYPNPIIINEYGWLWLNRDGSTTPLTDKVYSTAFGEGLSANERLYLCARHVGMLTEFWRGHRLCTGVMHFCALGYSRPHEPRGQTSDNFADVKNLIWQPYFEEYVKPAFAPVGLMVNFWDKYVNKNIEAGLIRQLEIYVINDLDKDWSGKLVLSIGKKNESMSIREKEVMVPAWGRVITTFDVQMPEEVGSYVMEAKINLDGEDVKSTREFSVRE